MINHSINKSIIVPVYIACSSFWHQYNSCRLSRSTEGGSCRKRQIVSGLFLVSEPMQQAHRGHRPPQSGTRKRPASSHPSPENFRAVPLSAGPPTTVGGRSIGSCIAVRPRPLTPCVRARAPTVARRWGKGKKGVCARLICAGGRASILHTFYLARQSAAAVMYRRNM